MTVNVDRHQYQSFAHRRAATPTVAGDDVELNHAQNCESRLSVIVQDFRKRVIKVMNLYLYLEAISISNKLLCIRAIPSDTVAMPKAAIQSKLGVEAQNQRLIFTGKQLNDDETPHSYSISDESAIHVCVD
jgi:hypothetical protein